jgi:hypothetical protein
MSIDLGASPTAPNASPTDSQAAQIRLALAAGKKLNSDATTVVEAGSNAAANGAALKAAVLAAATATPHELPSPSPGNPFTVYVTPGKYQLGVGESLELSAYVRLIGLTGDPADVVIRSTEDTSAVKLVEGSELHAVTLEMPGTDAAPYSDTPSMPDVDITTTPSTLTVVTSGFFYVNKVTVRAPYFKSLGAGLEGSGEFHGTFEEVECYHIDDANQLAPFGYGVFNMGTFKNCKAGSFSFCYRGNNQDNGLIDGCVGGNFSFCAVQTDHSDSTSIIRNCTAGSNSFYYAGSNRGLIENCIGSHHTFCGAEPYAGNTGIIRNCTGGDESFLYNSTGGTMERCVASSSSFQYNNGKIENCKAGFCSFRYNDNAGVINNCEADFLSFGSVQSSNGIFGTNYGIIKDCKSTNNSFCSGFGAENNGLIKDCSGADNCFCSDGAHNNGSIYNCTSASFMCESSVNYGLIENCKATDSFMLNSENTQYGLVRNCKSNDGRFCLNRAMSGRWEDMEIALSYPNAGTGDYSTGPTIVDGAFYRCRVLLSAPMISTNVGIFPARLDNFGSNLVTDAVFRNCMFPATFFTWGNVSNLSEAVVPFSNPYGDLPILNATHCIAVDSYFKRWEYTDPYTSTLQNPSETFPPA